jgi:hypothetical protein
MTLSAMTLSVMAAFCVQATAQGAFPAPLPNQSSGAASPFPPVNQSGGTAASSPAAASPFPAVNNAGAASAAPKPSVFPSAGSAAASQGSFPAQGATPLGGGLAAGGFGAGSPQGGGAEQQDCMEKFAPLRQEAERRAAMIKAASERKAAPPEACGLIKAYVAAEAKVVNYVTTKQTACQIPAEIPKQLKASQAKSHQMMKVVCEAANRPQGGPAQAAPSLSEALGSSSAPEVRSVRGGGSTFDTLNGNVLTR